MMMLVDRYLSAVVCIIASAGAVGASEPGENIDIAVVAAQIRSQGYACTNPTAAESIAAESLPDEPVDVLRCENATYKVRLVPDQAAKVTQIE